MIPHTNIFSFSLSNHTLFRKAYGIKQPERAQLKQTLCSFLMQDTRQLALFPLMKSHICLSTLIHVIATIFSCKIFYTHILL